MADELKETYNGTNTQTTQVGETPEQQYARLYPSATTTNTSQVVTTTDLALTQELRQLRNELASLRTSTVKPVEPTPSETAEWVEEIKKGNYAAAQQVIVKETLKTIKPQFDQELQQVRDRAYQQALEATQVQLEIEKHLQSVRTGNPDLVQFEKYMQAPIAARVELAQKAGKINNPQDFIREYKQAVDAEVGELRKIGLQIRGAAAQQAVTRQTEVRNATPLEPNQVQLGSPQAQTGEPNVETTDDYFARRRAQEYRNRGLSQT